MRDSYGRNSVGEKALLARRLVEAGTTFVLVSGAWGYFDHHGDNVPPWGGIQKGLTPILPTMKPARRTRRIPVPAASQSPWALSPTRVSVSALP